MNSECVKCGEPLIPGTRVLQVARGYYYQGFITPTYASSSSVLLEGHEDCLADFPVYPQRGLYDCLVCQLRIQDGAEVVYAVTGSKPRFPYKRPESRGYYMPFVSHGYCWEQDHAIAGMNTWH